MIKNATTLHPIPTEATYVTVILPIAVPKPYTYIVPDNLVEIVQFGVRVEVQFGRTKLYSGLVIAIHNDPPANHKPKPLLAIIDDTPVINQAQLTLWEWMASYYCCTLGEVMNAALPAGLKLNSETSLVLSSVFDGNFELLTDKEYLVAEALTIQEEITVSDVQKILGQKTVAPIIYKLIQKRVIYVKEELREKFKPKKIACVELQEPYASDEESLQTAFEKVKKANRQEEALMAFLMIYKQQEYVRTQDIYKKANVDASVLKAMEKKGIFKLYKKELSRLGGYEADLLDSPELSEQQVQTIASMKTIFEKKDAILLHGVTGSGKTRVYIELMNEVIANGGQVLYLVPEIALTAQIISRLQKLYGDEIVVYNSRINDHERVEVWKSTLANKSVILGARSALFLPFQHLQLIIVDEEHDPSYKQMDPAPRYSARDVAVFMAHVHQAKVVLGTATPSIESYQNTKLGKYGLVEMPKRFGGSVLPEIILVDKKEEYKQRKMQSHFTSVLIEELKGALEREEQAILFQNRRGHSPVIRCNTCGWHQECVNCDVSLTYHKFSNNLRCHYCGYQSAIPQHCPACGDAELSLKGFGTEKIEDELKIFFPDARIGRMDFDTVRTKNAHAKIINDFEEKRLDILVGTQMVTKGLDFDNVGVVGVLSADHLLQFPNFRSTERAFQLITQVSGRAGRKQKRGKVVIQTFDTAHPVIQEILKDNFKGFFSREIKERHTFAYPPFFRLIQITLQHKKPRTLNEASYFFVKYLKEKLGQQVIGPAIPGIPRVRSYYLLDVLIKMPRNTANANRVKQSIQEAKDHVRSKEGYSTIRIKVNVDPY